MKIKANKLVIFFLLIGVSIPLLIVGKIFYNQYAFNSDEDMRSQLTLKISESEKASPEKIRIVRVEPSSKEKIKYVTVYYEIENGSQRSKTFTYTQAVFGKTVIGKAVK